jgi:hypothetical protein
VHATRQEIAHPHAVDPSCPVGDRLHFAVVVHAGTVAGRGQRVLEAETLGKEQEIVEVVAGPAQVIGLDRRLEA